MKNILSKKFLLCLCSFFLFLLSFCGVLLPLNSFAFTPDNTETNAVKIDELWLDKLGETDIKKFNGDNVNLLLQLVSGDTTSSVFDLSKIKTQASKSNGDGKAVGKTAKEIRETEITAEFNGITKQKSNMQDIIVTLGGLDWTVTYLSLDDNNNPILTLWLANSEQLSGKVYYSTGYGTDAYTTSTYNANGTARWAFRNGSPNASSGSTDYPDSMYATSYIRSVILNNGGEFTTASGGRTKQNWESTPDNAFAPFTISEDGEYNDIVDFIVTPNFVSWQKNQSFTKQFSSESTVYYNRSNEAWSTETSNDGFFAPSFNYVNKPKYSVWKDDKIWLPSLTEIGYYSNDGIWATSQSQRSAKAVNTGLRTSSYNAHINVAYIGFNSDNTGNSPVDNSYSVRPALHLNLNDVVEHTTTKRDISLCEFNTLDPEYWNEEANCIKSQQWNPIKNIIPEITVKDNLFKFQPIKDVDYKIEIPEITKPGVVEIKVIGQDRYKGEKIITIELTKRDLAVAIKDNSLEIEEQYFCNAEIKPTFTNLKDYGYLAPLGIVKVDEDGTPTNLVQDVDYEVTYFKQNMVEGSEQVTYEEVSAPKDVGTYKMELSGINNYYGNVSTTFIIVSASIADGTLTLQKTSTEYYYDEDLINEIVETLVLEDLTLVKDKDYLVTYYSEDDLDNALSTITDIGNYIVVVTGIGNYRDSKQINFEVTKATIKDEFITLEKTSYTYTGFSINPNFVVSFNYVEGKTYTFIETQDFTTEFGTNLVVLTGGKVTITGTGKFRGTASASFDITPKDITSEDIEESNIEDQNYYVSSLTPEFTLTDNSREEVLLKNTDYLVEYSQNINVGIAVITITGTGNYTGTRVKNFKIIPRDINNATFKNISNVTYTGEELTPSLTITDRESKTLIFETDYLTEYSNNINITTSAIVVVTGTGNYSGTKQLNFTIDPRSIEKGVVTLNPETSVYNGSSFSPIVTLTLDDIVIDKTATEDSVNYEVEYYLGGTKVTEMVNVGVYTIKVIGKTNYSRETSTTFEITKYDIVGTTNNEYITSFSYNKQSQVPTITLNYGELVLENVTHFTTEYFKENKVGDSEDITLTKTANPTDAGTYQIVLSGIGNYKGSFTGLKFTIQTISLDDCVVKFSDALNINDDSLNIVFDYSNKQAEVTSVKIGEVEVFAVSADAVVRKYVNIAFTRNEKTTTDFKNHGDITLSITPATSNLVGSFSKTYTIKQKDISQAKLDGDLIISGLDDRTYTREKQTITVGIIDEVANNYVLSKTTDYTVTINEDELTNAKDGIEVLITCVENGNYVGTILETLNIKKAIVDSFTLQKDEEYYNGKSHTITPIVKAGKLVLSSSDSNKEYSFALTKNGNPIVELDLINVGEILVTVTLEDTNNFEFASDFVNTKTFTITNIELGSVTLRTNSVQYDTLAHKIVITKVETKNGIPLLTDEYSITYNGTDIDTYTDAITVKVEVTALDTTNYTGSVSTNFTITPRPINRNEIKYFVANSSGTITTTEINLSNKYIGEYVLPDINISEGNTKLELSTDYTFGIYLTSDKTYVNNLFGTDDYLEVGSYNFVITGRGNFSGTIIQNYSVSVADFNNGTISFSIPTQKQYTSNNIEFNLNSSDVSVSYTKEGHDAITLQFETDFVKYTGYIEATFKAGSTTEIESAVTLSKPKVADNVFYVTNGYFNNLNTGFASVVITAVSGSNYQTGTVVVSQFRITQVEITEEEIEFSNLNQTYTYTGSNITPVFNIKSLVTTRTLSLTTDYTIEYLSNNTDVGNVSFKITGKGNYTGSITYNDKFEIVAKNVEASMFQISKNEVFNTLEQKPTVSGIFNSRVLTINSDYSVTFKRGSETTTDFTNAGTISVIIKGLGNFGGEFIHDYKILKLQITTLQLSNSSATFTGTSLKPTISVLDANGNILTQGFKLQYMRDGKEEENFIDIGTTKISVIVTDTNNYELAVTELSSTFTITKASFATATISLDNASLAFTGEALVPNITIELNGETVDEENYELSFVQETQDGETPVTEMINVGSYKIIATATNNYEGTLQTHFTITRYDINNSSTEIPTGFEKIFIYNGKVQKPIITLKYGTQTLEEQQDFTITYRKEHLSGSVVDEPSDAGTYFIIIMGMGNYTGTINNLTFEIKPLSLNSENANITFKGLDNVEDVDYTFNGLEQKVEVASITINDIEFFETEGEYISVLYSRNGVTTNDFISAGNIDIRVEANNNDNIAGFYEYSYTIKQKEFTTKIIVSGLEDRPYSRTEQQFDIVLQDEEANNYKLVKDKDYTINFSSNCIAVQKDIVATFTPVGSGNYKGSAFTKTFSINKAVIDSFELVVDERVYTGLAHEIKAAVKAGELEVYDTEDYLEYNLIYKRNASAMTNLTSSGQIQVDLMLLDTTNFEIDKDLVTTLTYTISKAEIKTLTLQETETEFNNKDHTIVIDSVTTVNSLTLEETDYNVTYTLDSIETNISTYKNACTVTVKVTAKENSNYKGSVAATYTITRREILNSDVTYFVADDEGNKTDIQFNKENMQDKYKGKKVYPSVEVNFDETYSLVLNNLAPEGDYTFSIYTREDFTNAKQHNLFLTNGYLVAGEYVFVVTGKNNFTGEIITNFVVNPADFNKSTISLTIPLKVDYTGSEIIVDFASDDVSVKYKKEENDEELTLTLDTDFELFSGFVEITYADDKQTILSYRTITESEYNNLKDTTSETKKVLKVENGYANNILSGIATLVITGSSNNFESNTIVLTEFTINRVTLDATITGIEEIYTYTGYAIVPEIRVLSNDTNLYLEEHVDYEIEYSNNTNVGYAGFIITAKNNYSGVIERNRAFYIAPKQIDETMFIISQDTVYNLTEQKPQISARYNSKIMTLDEDYEVTFKRDNEVTTNFTSAGNIVITIKGINNYSSEFTKTYTIEKWVIKEVKLDINEVTYNTLEQKPNIQVLDGDGNEVNSAGYEITYSTQNFTDAGTIIIFANVLDNVNYALFTDQVSAIFTINKEDLSKTTTTIEDEIFTSLEIKPTFNLFLEEHILDEKEFVVSGYENNTNAGKAKIIVTSQNINYFGVKEIEFTILPKQLEEQMYSIVEEKTFVYNGSEQTLDFELRYTLNDNYSSLLVRGTDYSVNYENNINANATNSAVLTITGINNYTGSLTRRFSIQKANPTVMVDLPMEDLFAGDSLESTNFLVLRYGSTAGTLTNTTISTLALANQVTWNFVPEDEDNYNNANGTINIPAYYETKVEFGDVTNLIASSQTNVSVRVTFKMNRKLEVTQTLPSANYQVIITRNGFDVINYEQSGTYNIRVAISNTNYKIVGQDNITFQVKPTTIYSYDNDFYAVCETGFDVNISLYVQVFDTEEDILNIIGEENFAKLENIKKLYVVEFYNDYGPVTTTNATIYFKTSAGNNYYILQDDELLLQENASGNIIVKPNNYILEVLIPPVNFMQYIIIGAIILASLVVVTLVIIIVVKSKKKRKGKLATPNGNVTNGAPSENYVMQNDGTQYAQNQNLNTLINQVNPNVALLNNQNVMGNNQLQNGGYKAPQQNINNNQSQNANVNYQQNTQPNMPYVNGQNGYYNNQNFNNTNAALNTKQQGVNQNNVVNQAQNLQNNATPIMPQTNVNQYGTYVNPQSNAMPNKPYVNNQNINTQMLNQNTNNYNNMANSFNNASWQNSNNANTITPLNLNDLLGIKTQPANNSQNGKSPVQAVKQNGNVAQNNVYKPLNQTQVNGQTNGVNMPKPVASDPNKNAPQKPKSSINPNSVLGNLYNQNPPKNN